MLRVIRAVLGLLPHVTSKKSLFIRAARVLCPGVQPRRPTAPIRPGNETYTFFFFFEIFSILLD